MRFRDLFRRVDAPSERALVRWPSEPDETVLMILEGNRTLYVKQIIREIRKFSIEYSKSGAVHYYSLSGNGPPLPLFLFNPDKLETVADLLERYVQ